MVHSVLVNVYTCISCTTVFLSIATVKYKMVITGKTFGAHEQLMVQVKSHFRDRAQLTQSSEDHHIVIVFCPITSRVGTDVEAAMADESGKRKICMCSY